MNSKSPLALELKKHLSWHQARINFLSEFLIALIQLRTVNFAELVSSFGGRGKEESNYRKIQRFFKEYDFSYHQVTQLIVSWLSLGNEWILCLDRTNWKFGKFNINLLVLGVAYKGVAIPVAWSFLEKRGNSNTEERISIISYFIRTFGKDVIVYLTADREFIGSQWIAFLKEEGICFRIRIRNNTKVLNSRGDKELKVCSLFRGLQIGEEMTLNRRKRVWGILVHITAVRLNGGEWLIIISDKNPQTAVKDYTRRWEIETLFGCLKSRGFNLESTHLQHPERINKLFALITIAFCWCYMIGEDEEQKKSTPLKTHGRKAKSIFRKGLDKLRTILLNLSQKWPLFIRAITFLSCT